MDTRGGVGIGPGQLVDWMIFKSHVNEKNTTAFRHSLRKKKKSPQFLKKKSPVTESHREAARDPTAAVL